MPDPRAHKFYCARCNRFLYAETLPYLANAINYHATTSHPSDFCGWTETNIVSSVNYSSAGPPPQYLVPHGTAQNSLHNLTEDDKSFLKRARIKW